MTNMRYESTINMITNKKQASFYWMNVKCKKLTKKWWLNHFLAPALPSSASNPHPTPEKGQLWYWLQFSGDQVIMANCWVCFYWPIPFQSEKKNHFKPARNAFRAEQGRAVLKQPLIPLGTHHKARLKSAAIFPWIPPFHAFSLQRFNSSVGKQCLLMFTKQSFLSTLVALVLACKLENRFVSMIFFLQPIHEDLLLENKIIKEKLKASCSNG